MGYWLGEAYWGKGYMTEAVKRMLAFAFDDLNLNRVNICAFVENEASNAVIRKVGFVFEGTKRQGNRSRASGKIHDSNEYGMLKEDWERAQK